MEHQTTMISLTKVNAWFKAPAKEWMEAAEYFEANGSQGLAATIRKGVFRQQARDNSGWWKSSYRETYGYGLRLQDGSADKVREYMKREEVSAVESGVNPA